MVPIHPIRRFHCMCRRIKYHSLHVHVHVCTTYFYLSNNLIFMYVYMCMYIHIYMYNSFTGRLLHASKVQHVCTHMQQMYLSLSGRGIYILFSSLLLRASSISQGWLVAASTITSLEESSPCVAPTPVVNEKHIHS